MFTGDFHKVPEQLETLTPAILEDVANFALQGLTKDEILDGYSIVWNNLRPSEQVLFNERYNYGRLRGISIISDALMAQARGKNGTAAAIAYLSKFSREWKENQEKIASDNGFVFNVRM